MGFGLEFRRNLNDMTGQAQNVAIKPGSDFAGARNEEAFHDMNLAIAVEQGQLGADQNGGRRLDQFTSGNRAIRDANAKRSKESTSTYMMLAMLDQIEAQIALFQEQIDDIDRQIETLKEELSAIDKLEALYNSGELDFDNPAHIKLMKQLGIAQEELENDADSAFDRARGSRHGKIDDLQKNRDDLIDKRDKAQDLHDRYLADPLNAEIREEIASLASTEDGAELAIKTAKDFENQEQQAQFLKKAGFSEDVVDGLFAEAQNGNDFFAAADTVEETPIKAASLEDCFSRVSCENNVDGNSSGPENSHQPSELVDIVKQDFSKNI